VTWLMDKNTHVNKEGDEKSEPGLMDVKDVAPLFNAWVDLSKSIILQGKNEITAALDNMEEAIHLTRKNLGLETNAVVSKEPKRDSVVVELIDGKFVVHIECQNKDILWMLEDVAKEIKIGII